MAALPVFNAYLILHRVFPWEVVLHPAQSFPLKPWQEVLSLCVWALEWVSLMEIFTYYGVLLAYSTVSSFAWKICQVLVTLLLPKELDWPANRFLGGSSSGGGIYCT